MKPLTISLIIIFLCSPGSVPTVSADHNFRWREFYQPITDQRAQAHLQKALVYVTTQLGAPSHRIDQVHLYLSQPKHSHDSIKKNFQLTEANDIHTGEFTIYLSHKPSEYACWGQLVHEITHLMDSRIHDAYFEGLSTVMAERYLKENGLDWNGWRAYFEKGQEPFYAHTYFMMREILDTVGAEGMRDFHKYTQTSPHDAGKLHIDINRWIQKFPPTTQSTVKKIIAKYASKIQLSMNQTHDSTTFQIPDIL